MDMRQTIAMASGRVNLNFLRGCEEVVMGLFFGGGGPDDTSDVCHSKPFALCASNLFVYFCGGRGIGGRLARLAKIDNHIPEGYNPRWFIGDMLYNPIVTFN